MKTSNTLISFPCDAILPLPDKEIYSKEYPSFLLKGKLCWGYILGPAVILETAIQQIINLKHLHERGYKTFAILCLAPGNLMQYFGLLKSLSVYCDLIQLTSAVRVPIPFLEDIFIPLLLKCSTTRLFITDGLLDAMTLEKLRHAKLSVFPGEPLIANL